MINLEELRTKAPVVVIYQAPDGTFVAEHNMKHTLNAACLAIDWALCALKEENVNQGNARYV